MEETLYRYNPWWEKGYSFDDFIYRPKVIELMKSKFSSKEVILLTGLRRAGKTTLLKLFIKNLIEEKKINPKLIFYISLDDYNLSKISILDLIEEYRKVHKIPYRDKIYLFLDEIASKKDFELQLKNLYDNQNVKIFASTSSASTLKSKKPFLTGRATIVEVHPLDYEEYLEFKKIKVSKSDNHLHEKYFEEYMKIGGLPEHVLYEDVSYLKELVDDIIYKDIVATHNIKDSNLLKDFFLLLMERAGKIASINKLARIMSLSPDTAKRYLQMFEETYLIYLLPRYGKTNDAILAPKKLYACDLGIRTFFTGFRDKGSLFENYVFFKIMNKNPKYVYENTLEIDFFTSDKTLIEVKYKDKLKGKQKDFFEEFKANKKITIEDIYDLKKLD